MKKALIWKLLERFGVQGVQFILQIILARLLDPEHYGILSLMVIFTNGFSDSSCKNAVCKSALQCSMEWRLVLL